jgi:hypothetical protein
MLFHHLLGGDGDPYILVVVLRLATREHVDAYLRALQAVIDRHDILRTSVVWEGVSEPLQVVWRQAPLPVDEVVLDPAAGPIEPQLSARVDPRRVRLDVRQAPWLRIAIAEDRAQGRWVMVQRLHHLAGDHSTLERSTTRSRRICAVRRCRRRCRSGRWSRRRGSGSRTPSTPRISVRCWATWTSRRRRSGSGMCSATARRSGRRGRRRIGRWRRGFAARRAGSA